MARLSDGSALGLFTDLYELRMAQACLAEGMTGEAAFSLYTRSLPERRNFLLACGLEDALQCLDRFRFERDDIEYLRSVGGFSEPFLKWLGEFRFEGDIHAMAEGTPVFAEEPLIEVVAPLAQAQLVETLVMNQISFATVLAGTAARVVEAAAGRPVLDFGLRRMHGIDAGLAGARAFHIAGIAGTSNTLAGKQLGVPVAGTMAHSYVQAHDDELAAFRRFAREFPETVLLVDTYDTLAGVRKVIALARELGSDFAVRAVRLDSGDLGQLARECRALLDDAGLTGVQILASGGLAAESIAALVRGGSPIDGFGIGTSLGVAADSPTLDMVYKLVAYAGAPRLKLSTGKRTLPGRKQVFRRDRGEDAHDVIALAGEALPGEPLLRQVVRRGERLAPAGEPLNASRARAREAITALPQHLRGLEDADPPYPVALSEELAALNERLSRKLRAASGRRRPAI